MTWLEWVFFVPWLVAFFLQLVGTIYAIWRIRHDWRRPSTARPPVSILKPLKGIDPGLEDNLRTFLMLDYPEFEIIFSVADPSDPVVPLVRKFIEANIEKHRISVIIGDVQAGTNPKVNNLIKSERAAKYDLLLVSDSNVRVSPDYLNAVVSQYTPDTGVVTAVVHGTGGQGTAGPLEEMHLNTFYVRWMQLAHMAGCGFVLGKSMLYSRSAAAQFGGIATLANFVAEDYMLGKMLSHLGKKIVVMPRPVVQFLGEVGLDRFVARHVRWSILQRRSAPWVFYMEPFSFALVASVMASLAFSSHVGYFLPFLASMAAWMALDVTLDRIMGGRGDIVVWLTNQALLPLIWLQACGTDVVDWRGNKIVVGAKGQG